MTRTGIGYDSHRLASGRRLVLGGVELDSELGLDGHSDADVLTHAVIDAVLGAAGLGDIGQHFPDTAAEFAGANSIGLLETAVRRVGEAGFRIGNVDATVVIEAPKLAPHRQAMEARLAGALGVGEGEVNVKATTGELVGFVGRGEGAAALAVATLERL